jgi:aminopeptidase N
LRQAGSLYGAIIYQKAPIVMRQLERLVGDSTFREGLRRYLSRYRFGNAGWPDLIAILDSLSAADLADWSRAWVEEPFRPLIDVAWVGEGIVVSQRDPDSARGLRWIQPVQVALGYPDTVIRLDVRLEGERTPQGVPRADRPRWILPGSEESSYGRFALDSASRTALLSEVPRLRDPVLRAAAWLALWEALLSGEVQPRTFLTRALAALETEPDELVAQHLLGRVGTVFWRFLPDSVRRAEGPQVEAALWRGLTRARGPSRKGAWWSAVVGMTTTPRGLARLELIWRRKEPPRGLPLAEPQYTALAEALALREVKNAEVILDIEGNRITNPDRKARFRFVQPALSRDAAVRDSVFASFAVVENRRRESWVLDAVGYVSHPLRARGAAQYVDAGLALVPEIQRTGDIFFPLNWLNVLLDGHSSAVVADKVQAFLAGNADLPPRLRGKLHQAADDLYRAARIVEGWKGPALEGEERSISGPGATRP